MSKDATRLKPTLALCAVGMILALGPAAASAATITPNITTDEDANNANCSLREAVTAANTDGDHNGCNPGGANDGPDVIVLGAGNTYSLTLSGAEDLNATGDLDIRDEDLTIQSSGVALATIDANGDGDGDPATTGDRAIHTAPNNVSTAVALTNLAITDGLGGSGGALRADTFTGGPTITGSTFFANEATSLAGALNLQGVNATITDSSIDNNTAPATGGIFASFGLTINRSTISDNTATAGGTGGIQFNNPITRTLTNTTVSGNSATADTGGIFASGATLNLVNSTVAGNTADSDNAGGGDGGGIFTNAGGVINPRNSIIADNLDLGGEAPDCSTALASQGYNLVENLAGCTGTVATDVTGQDPVLGALGSNGGLTETRALLPGSPALNAANPAVPGSGGMACEAIDQRGQSRTTFQPCDIGAFEIQAADTDGDRSPDPSDNCPAQPGPASNGGCPLPVAAPPVAPAAATTASPTGRRAAALKKCKKKKGRARAKCKKKAKLLPV